MAQRTSSLLLIFLTPFAFAFIIFFVIFRAYWIPSGSMKPSLLVGDYVFANRAAYGFPALFCGSGMCADNMGPLGREVRRGDVATFRHPVSGEHWVKRVLAVSGDTVQMRGGLIYLNGAVIEQAPDGTFTETFNTDHGAMSCSNGPVGVGGDCLKPRFVEELPNGRAYAVLNVAGIGSLGNTEAVTVPKGHVFVMGDNRSNSLDSRVVRERGGVGFVPLDHVVGRVDLIVFSMTGQDGRLFRWVE